MKIEQTTEISISRLVLQLRPFDTISNSNASFFRKFFDNCVDAFDAANKKNPKWAKENWSYNPMHNMDNDTLTGYCNGRKNISQRSFKNIQPVLNKENFKKYYNNLNIPPEEDEHLYKSIVPFYPKADSDSLFIAYWEVLQKLIDEGAEKKSKKTGPKKFIPISPLCSADTEGDFEERVKKSIRKIIQGLDGSEYNREDMPIFRVREKIKDSVLCHELENDLDYFPLINEEFVDASSKNGKPEEYILKSVHRHYEKLAQHSEYSERDIVRAMQAFFADKAGFLPESAECKVVTTYFIQLCEVFRGTSGKNS